MDALIVRCSLHVKTPEFLELIQDIRRTTPILMAKNDKAVQGFATGTNFEHVNLGLQLHPVPKCEHYLGFFGQRIHLRIHLSISANE